MKKNFIITFFLLMITVNSYANDTIETLLKMAERGEVEAQYQLGLLYKNIDYISKNDKKAFEWYEKAALQGHEKSQIAIGIMYAKGIGTIKNEKKAFEWIEKTALKGMPIGQWLLGNLYFSGLGTSKNYKKAFEWYEKAALQNYAEAQYHLGTMYYYGNGVPKDYVMAYAYFNIAASNSFDSFKEYTDLYRKQKTSVKIAENQESNKDMAKFFRNSCEKEMTPSQVEKAQEISRELYKKINNR
jgi:hypothetical protein